MSDGDGGSNSAIQAAIAFTEFQMRMLHTLFILPNANICYIIHSRNEFTVNFVTQILPKKIVCVHAHFNPSANIYPSICLRCCTIITANEKCYGEKTNTKRNFDEYG